MPISHARAQTTSFVNTSTSCLHFSFVLGHRCHELPKSPRITEITKKLTEITTKRTEITGTSCRYMFTGFKNVTFITVSNMRIALCLVTCSCRSFVVRALGMCLHVVDAVGDEVSNTRQESCHG